MVNRPVNLILILSLLRTGAEHKVAGRLYLKADLPCLHGKKDDIGQGKDREREHQQRCSREGEGFPSQVDRDDDDSKQCGQNQSLGAAQVGQAETRTGENWSTPGIELEYAKEEIDRKHVQRQQGGFRK